MAPADMPMPEVAEDAQARVVATTVVETAAAYFSVAERLHGGEEIDFSALRVEAAALTARTASLLREARSGLAAHEGHGCAHEQAYEGVADFLQVLLETGAGLLEVHSLDQVDQQAATHPFGHLVPLLLSPTRDWLLEHVDDEQQEQLVEFIDHAEEVAGHLYQADVRLYFGPLADEAFASLQVWFEEGGPHGEVTATDPAASVLAAHILELHNQVHDDPDSGCPSFGEVDTGVVCIEGDLDRKSVV